jgi:endonuclease YncB( thermonuclease family)
MRANTMKRIILPITGFLFTGLVLLALPGAATAHDGNLDRKGCHENRPFAGYHCHKGPLAGQYFRDRAEAEKIYPKPKAKPKPKHAKRPAPRRDAKNIFGRATVIDGDTIEIRGERIKIFGIDAFERRQRCRRADGKRYRCGRTASRTLADKIDNRRISCRKKTVAKSRRIYATCWIGAEDIGASMVLAGWAIADTRRTSDYTIHEARAQRRRTGAWQGDFLKPREWRQRQRNRDRNRDRKRDRDRPWRR